MAKPPIKQYQSERGAAASMMLPDDSGAHSIARFPPTMDAEVQWMRTIKSAITV
jgi:hypothetical protein